MNLHYANNAYFYTKDVYKAIDKIYIENPKETADIIYELAMDLDDVKDDIEDRMFVLYNLLAAH